MGFYSFDGWRIIKKLIRGLELFNEYLEGLSKKAETLNKVEKIGIELAVEFGETSKEFLRYLELLKDHVEKEKTDIDIYKEARKYYKKALGKEWEDEKTERP